MLKRLFQRIKLFSNPRKELFYSFYQVLGFYPQNIELYHLAIRHRSKPIKTEHGEVLNNERLEYLGDAILNAVVSDILYHQYPHEQEGFLTNVRSRIVKRETLNELCVLLKLDKLIIANKSLHFNNNQNFNMLGNTLEALIGATYLDFGYAKCVIFVKNKLFPLLPDLEHITSKIENPKSQLIEWCQKYHFQFDFILIDETVGANNVHTFLSQLEIEGITVSRGIGTSKKESQQNASILALEYIQSDKKFIEKFQNYSDE